MEVHFDVFVGCIRKLETYTTLSVSINLNRMFLAGSSNATRHHL